jgi:hydantoinase/carbamoylase family amidase
MKPDYQTRALTIMHRINELASISEAPGIITRTFGTPAFIKAGRLVFQWMQQAGLHTRIDSIGNVRGRLLSNHKHAKTLVIASHIDSVINAGKFDGPLGVLMGLDIIEQLIQQKTSLPFHVEVIAFSDEEGVRFHTTYLGSKVVAGAFDTRLLNQQDNTGASLKQVLQSMGGSANNFHNDAIPANDWLCYFEIHIEQGPVLYEKDIPVAIVTAIAGQKRVAITFKGEAGHAGTVPMHMRKDALGAASEFILAAEQIAANHPHHVVATVGKLDIAHAASNVIPGEVNCTLDVRCADEAILSSFYSDLEQLAAEICSRRDIDLEWKPVQETNSVICDPTLNELLAKAIRQSGYEVIELVSGAGHDAVAVAPVSPVAMLFVRCFKGISHNPLEDVELKDIAAAIEVSDNFINYLTQKYNQG